MNEAETRADLIDPALLAAGWGVVPGSRIRREVITLGRLEGAGRRARGKAADYVLTYKGQKLAVLEAKARAKPDTEGLAQAKDYAALLQARFAFSTNGDGIYRCDMQTGAEGHVTRYPTPDELWAETFAQQRIWRDRFGDVPLADKSGAWQPRYYQHNAVNAVLEAIADGRDRILLTLATGTGKTSIAFQIAWKLFQSRWSLAAWKSESGELGRRPRILFLADRNNLANQAYNEFNSFAAFAEDALARIDPEAIRKRGQVPKNANVFFTIFQTFMTGSGAASDTEFRFEDYPPDFFDLVIIDECHRGGARDESTWREILQHFAPAVHLGLTATPKRKTNADTYAYFGEPVYSYSLKEGINDGFLTPFKVRQIGTTLDDYIYTPDDHVVAGEPEEGRLYTEGDFNRLIIIPEREKYRVGMFMAEIDQTEKTIVFCATQEHAAMVRDLINQIKTSQHPNYCVRVTANDGKIGDDFLETFKDNEKTIPTILTTSQKLSTGVDARNVRNIVLMRPVNSMIEFKQIIGRGTRLFDGKDHFTVYDFVKAYHHFNDPEWDGEPLEPEPVNPRPAPVPGPDNPGDPSEPGGDDGGDGDDDGRPQKIKIKLADGKVRQIQHMAATSFWSPDGKPISAADFIQRMFGDLPDLFKDEDELRTLWGNPATRRALLEGLADRGYGEGELTEVARVIDAANSDLFDVLAYIAFNAPPITRTERVETCKPSILASYDDKLAAFLNFVLGQYVKEGVGVLDQAKLGQLLGLKYGTVSDATLALGDVPTIREAFTGFQQGLY